MGRSYSGASKGCSSFRMSQLVRVDQMLSGVSEAHRLGVDPPILFAQRNLPQPS